NKDKKIYVYCLSGMRASRAVKQLRNMGYTNVKNIGGINSYKGKKVK
ncbi:MAG: rhodanese-like domain-containing protein, partial [Solobacterium sp.]|nr:rhodanese-like domain-containing protein [Solobacterium sp.]